MNRLILRKIPACLVMIGLCLIALAGCGHDYGPTGKITGMLTMDGKPLPAGHNVSFMQMETGFLAFGTTDAEGKFEVNTFNNGDMPVGMYKVMVALPPPTAKPEAEVSAEDRFEKPETIAPKKIAASFPKKYSDTTTSGIEYEIKPGANHFDIDLKSK